MYKPWIDLVQVIPLSAWGRAQDGGVAKALEPQRAGARLVEIAPTVDEIQRPIPPVLDQVAGPRVAIGTRPARVVEPLRIGQLEPLAEAIRPREVR